MGFSAISQPAAGITMPQPVRVPKGQRPQGVAAKAAVASAKPADADNPRFIAPRTPPAIAQQQPPYFVTPPTADFAYNPTQAYNNQHHDTLPQLQKTGKNAADLQGYTFGQYRADRDRADRELLPLFQQMLEVFDKGDPKANKALGALMYDQSKKYDVYNDQKNNFWTDVVGALREVTSGKTLDYTALKNFNNTLRGAEAVPVPDVARKEVDRFKALIKQYDAWRTDARNHPFLKAESVRAHADEFRKKIVGDRKTLRKKYLEGYRIEKMKQLEADDRIARSRGAKGMNTAEMDKQADAYAKLVTEKEFDNNGKRGQGQGISQYFDTFDDLVQQEVLEKFDSSTNDDKSVQQELYDPLRRMQTTFDGIKLSSQAFTNLMNDRMEDKFLENKISKRIRNNKLEFPSLISAPQDNPDDKFKKMVNFIMDGYGYQQMADLVRQYVHTFNDYQNIALDLAKIGSGRQVQEIERMVRARINIADQRDTYRTLRDYNKSVHEAHMDSLSLESDVISMEGEKRRRYIERMKRMLDNATRDRMVDMEAQRAALVNAALLRDAQSKVEASEQDLANQTLQSSQNIMAKQFQGSVLAESLRERVSQAMMEMEMQRMHNTFNRIKSMVQMMRY